MNDHSRLDTEREEKHHAKEALPLDGQDCMHYLARATDAILTQVQHFVVTILLIFSFQRFILCVSINDCFSITKDSIRF